MSSEHIFEHHKPVRFILRTIGNPGEREFYIQVVSEHLINTVLLEKSQAAALIEQMELIIRELRRNQALSLEEWAQPIVSDNEAMQSPIEPDFRISSISLGWESDLNLFLVELGTIRDASIPNENQFAEQESEDEELKVIIRTTLPMIRGFITTGKRVIAAGRTPCPFCGLPIDSSGHLCPRANGYRR